MGDSQAAVTPLQARKRRLRAQMEVARRAVPEARARAAAEAVARLFLADPALAGAPRIALYAATPGELRTDALAQALAGRGRPLLWPRVRPGRRLEFARATAEQLVAGRHGLREPPPACVPLALIAGDVVLVPGLAFDRRGGRLGRGGGYYDRVLDSAPEGVIFVGLGHALQCVEEVPMGPLDRRVHALLSEDGLHWVRG